MVMMLLVGCGLGDGCGGCYDYPHPLVVGLSLHSSLTRQYICLLLPSKNILIRFQAPTPIESIIRMKRLSTT